VSLLRIAVIALLCAAATQAPVFAQTGAGVNRGSASRTLTTPQPPPPPPRDAERAADRAAAREQPEVAADAQPATPEVRVPGGAELASRPQSAIGARAARELLVASTDIDQADAQRSWLSERGAQLLRRRVLDQLGWVLSAYRLKPGVSSSMIVGDLTREWPDALPEINQVYPAFAQVSVASPREFARELIAWPANCPAAPRIVMLDGPVNIAIPALQGRRIVISAIAPADESPDYDHGTSLAALLLGTDAPNGLLPEAELLVGVIMNHTADGPVTTTEQVLRGLDWVLSLKPAPASLNLSFGGPSSAQLARALEVVARAMPIAAAAGNEGRGVSFPAAHPKVVAVTAVDAKGRRWSRANTGSSVAIAAPGVEVWSRGGDGQGRYLNGTSVATLFVTAALAASDRLAPSEWLDHHTRDAGNPGRDPIYGHGVLAMGGACTKVKP